MEDAFNNKKIKTKIDSDRKECNSIKSIGLKGYTNIKLTSRFIKRKIPMFEKISLKSFVYNTTDVFCIPTEEVKISAINTTS